MARALLDFSEQLVNQLNERARQDSLATFQREVETTEQQIAKIQTELTAYRIKEKMLDPKSAAAGPIELLAKMNAELANSRAQLTEILKNAPNSPQIPLIRTRIGSLENLIADQRGKITGDSNSLATALTEYERLDVQRMLQGLIDAKDLNEAIGIAGRIPGARWGTVEIRPVLEIPGLPKKSALST